MRVTNPASRALRLAGEGDEAERRACLRQADPSDNDMSHGVARLKRRWISSPVRARPPPAAGRA